MKSFITAVIMTLGFNGFAQLNMEQITSITLGQTFDVARPKIKAMFSQKPSITKADFFGAYRIEYENVPFNYYGDANYTFQFAKDTLVAIQINFPFRASDTSKFRRLYNTLLADLNNDNSKRLLKEYSDLNPKKIFPYVVSNCVTNTEKDDKSYKPINKKFLGQSFWAIDNSYSGKFIRIIVQLYESHSSKMENGKTSRYDGCIVEATIEITSERYQDLKNQEEELEFSNYHNYVEPTEQIKLTFQNGVYKVPVKLNNTLTMDFVLDLGASDVSISPDIFLVLYRAGTIQESDFIGSQSYQFADGSTAKSSVFNIKSIQIGNKEIKNVRASISNSLSAPLLLGQSALKQLTGYRIDNDKNLLIIE